MLLTTHTVLKWNAKSKEYYESKGYIFTKYKDPFLVKVEDLSFGCTKRVMVQCDYCEKVDYKIYSSHLKQNENKFVINKDCCIDCIPKKQKESNLIQFGVESTNKLPEVIEKKRISKTFSQEIISEEFKKRDLILIGEYQRCDVPVEFICPIHKNEKPQYITFNNLKLGYGCHYCTKERIANFSRHSQEFIENEFYKNGLTLLDTYINANTPMKCICNIHQDIIQTKTYSSIYSGNGCKICGRIKAAMSNIQRHTMCDAKIEFEKRNYKLIEEEYINMSTKMRYICNLHPEHIQNISLTNLIQGNGGCYYCGIVRLTGENSVGWKGGITALSNYLRQFLYKSSWYLDSIKHNNYKCVITGKIFEELHHIHNFSDILLVTLKELNLPINKNIGDYTEDNLKLIESKFLELHYVFGFGVCFTKKTHAKFHSIYGKYNNTLEQLNDFIKNYNLIEGEK